MQKKKLRSEMKWFQELQKRSDVTKSTQEGQNQIIQMALKLGKETTIGT